MQSALPQSSLNQRLGVIHKLISNVQPCRIAKRLKELHCLFFFLIAKLKENKTYIGCSQGPTIQVYLINLLNIPPLLPFLCFSPPGIFYREVCIIPLFDGSAQQSQRDSNINTFPPTATPVLTSPTPHHFSFLSRSLFKEIVPESVVILILFSQSGIFGCNSMVTSHQCYILAGYFLKWYVF